MYFTPGLNAISGSSGAGKSLLLDALQQLLGATAHADCVRHPADMAVVEGVWWLGPGIAAAAADLLSGMGLPSKALPGAWLDGSTAAAAADDDPSSCGVLHIRREVREQCSSTTGSRYSSDKCAQSANQIAQYTLTGRLNV